MQFKYTSFNLVLLTKMAGWACFEMCSWSVWAVTFNMPLGFTTWPISGQVAKQSLPSAWRHAWVSLLLHYLELQARMSIIPPGNHCVSWPTGILTMATRIPADVAVKNRSSQKYERQVSDLVCMQSLNQGLSWSCDLCINLSGTVTSVA